MDKIRHARQLKQDTKRHAFKISVLWVVAGLAMAPAVALGLARFAYALLLPPMRAELAWSYADAGAMNTANAIGYLAGALTAARVTTYLSAKRTFMISLMLTAAAIGAAGLTKLYGVLIALRFAAGLTGAFAFVAGGSLASATASRAPGQAPVALGLYFSGGGAGILLSALAVPPLLSVAGWQSGWLALGATAFAACGVAALALPHAAEPQSDMPGKKNGGTWSPRVMAVELAAYMLYGAGYIAYATFIISYLREVEGFTVTGVTLFWALLGAASIIGAFLWGPVLSRLKGGRSAAATIAAVSGGAALPLIWSTDLAAYISSVFFGGSFLAVIAAVTSFARRAAPPHRWTAAIGALTAAFGIGQCAGPVLSGALSDGRSGVVAGLWLSVGILALAAAVALFQREPRQEEESPVKPQP